MLLFLQGLQEEGLDLGAQIETIRPLVQGNPSHQHKMDQLSTDYQALQRSLEVNRVPGIIHSRGLFCLFFLYSYFSFSLPVFSSSFIQQTIIERLLYARQCSVP